VICRFIDVPQIFLPLKSVALPEKKLKNTRTVDQLFLRMEIQLERQLDGSSPIHPRSRMQHSDFFLPTTSRPVSVLANDVMFPSKWNFRLVYPRSGSRH